MTLGILHLLQTPVTLIVHHSALQLTESHFVPLLKLLSVHTQLSQLICDVF